MAAAEDVVAFLTRDDRVVAGGEVTVPASPGSTVRVVWVGPDGTRQILAIFDVPE